MSEHAFPLIVDHEREYLAGDVIRKAVEHDAATMRFYLTCSVGELAQRVVLALPVPPASAPAATPGPFLVRAADTLAHEVNRLLEGGVIGARSPAGDALLDYAQERHGQHTANLAECLERAAATPEPDTFQMAGDVLSGKRRIEDVLAELRPAASTGEEAETAVTMRDVSRYASAYADYVHEPAGDLTGEPREAHERAYVALEARLTAQATALAALRARETELTALLREVEDCYDANSHRIPRSLREIRASIRAALAPRQPEESQK